MKIKSLSIKNFRGIESLELDFLSPDGTKPNDLLVFAGANGSGKTSIIEACLLALGMKDAFRTSTVAKNDIREGCDDYLIELVVEHGEKTYDFKKTSKSGSSRSQELTALLNESALEYFSSWREPKLAGPVTITAGKKGKRPAITEENRLWRLKQHLVNVTARKAFGAAPDSQQNMLFDAEKSAFDRLQQMWNMFYPEGHDTFQALPVSDNVDEGFDLFIKYGRSGEMISTDALSSGEIEVLAFASTFVITDFAGGIVFIDEPELHLHPAWQRIILPALHKTMPGIQIIAATHSPQVLSCISPESVLLISRENGKMTVSSPEDSFGLDSNRILEDLMKVPERPAEMKKRFDELFALIDNNQLELARQLIAELKGLIHADPDLVKAETIIRRKEILGK